MKELLRVVIGAAQIREACERWATYRAGTMGGALTRVDGIADDAQVSVVFTKARKPRATKPKEVSA
ncbi:MAG: hypothetical protein ACREM8_14095 [Vulcanimicrobiaceae bacterium]